MLRRLKWRVLRSLVADYRREGLDDFWILTRIARDVYPDYKFRWPDWDWLKQERFWAFVRELDDERGVNADRKWMLGQLFRLCIDLPGDTAECGVLNGASSVLICEAIARRGRGDKTHHLFDSFEGLSEPGAKDGSHWSRGDLKVSEEDALKNLDPGATSSSPISDGSRSASTRSKIAAFATFMSTSTCTNRRGIASSSFIRV